MTITQSHNLSHDEAVKRIDGFLDQLEKKFEGKIKDPSRYWTDPHAMQFSFKIAGFDMKGVIEIKQKEVVVSGKIPWLFDTLYGKEIEKIITTEMKKLLA